MKNKILLIFCLCSSILSAQEFITGEAVQIISENAISMISTDGDAYEIILNDTKTIEKNKSLALNYLNEKILNQKVIVYAISKAGDKIHGSIMYNCVQIPNFIYEEGEIPCSQGNILDFEMIKLGLLEYTGKNSFLEKIKK